MKLHALAMLCPALVAVSQALASPVDCQIEKSDHLVLIGKSLRISPDAGLWMTVQGKLRNGEEVSYAKDDPIVVADIKILRTTPSFVASTAVTLTSEGLIGPFNSLKVRIAARSPVAALQEIALPDGTGVLDRAPQPGLRCGFQQDQRRVVQRDHQVQRT